MFKNQVTLALLAVIGSAAPRPGREARRLLPSVGLCNSQCEAAGFPVFGLTNGTGCVCGKLSDIPAAEIKVDDALCDKPCPGFAPQKCE
ncbi:hypothetical protein PG993_013584 [Apiospora rasikravindrae]|uniref:WSC domain-containing protein n=1 Tax=Apiospora rasikravindrae TaxID=990691 RepID=A0ABR1RY18_9PEZI